MGSSSKKYKEKDRESRKRRHRSPSETEEFDGASKEKRHRHHRKHHHHHKEKRRERNEKYDYAVQDDVIEVFDDEAPSPPSRQEETQERDQNKSADSLSIEETNKLRAKLGLKPLEVGSSTSEPSSSKPDDKKKDDWGEFYHKPAENWAEKAEREKLKAKFTEHREKRHLQDKLSKVKLLGESDSDEDAELWVNKNRKVEQAKKEAEKRAKMLEELDAQFGVGEILESEQREKRRQQYTEKNLRGLRVDHDIDSFAEERNVVLTLKDKGVLEEEDDVLVNVNMLDDERYKKSNENRKKKQLYNAYEDQEFDQYGNPKDKSLLSKYDEEIEGEKRESFVIGQNVAIERKLAAARSIKEKLAKKHLESIPEKELKLASEYYNEEELAKFKKPKKKARKIRSKGKLLTADELEQGMNNKGIENVGSRRPKFEIDLDDVPAVQIPTAIRLEDEKDDLLEKALHKARKIKQKENIAAEIMKTISEVKTEVKEENTDGGNITLNATAEFCRTLGDIPTYGKSGNRNEIDDLEIDYEKDIKEEEEDDDCEIIEVSGWNSVDPNESHEMPKIAPQEVQILDEEPDVSKGMGAALKVAMSKGYLDKETTNRPSNSRLAYLQAQHYSIEDKSYGDDDRGNRRDRYSGPIQEFKEKDSFKPNVKLEYIDDEGHVLNSKEAFRYLSHKFHGKGPGKNKVEKRIKKSIQEQLMKKMSSTDTPLGTLNMLQAKQKETQSPFVVLSGNKQSQSTVISKSRR